LLRREGWQVNHKRTYRLYTELGLQLRNKTPKRRVRAKLRDDRQPASRPSDIWAMDSLHDQLATGRRPRADRDDSNLSRQRPCRTRITNGQVGSNHQHLYYPGAS
jgi:putative transposase